MDLMTALPLRTAARVIALDDDHRVLLLRYEENGGFWATPGGSLNDGEDHQTALLRELREELGVDESLVQLSGQIAERSKRHKVGGHDVRQVERYYLAHLTAADLDPTRADQPDTNAGHHWWRLDELRQTPQTIYPTGLTDLITQILTNGPPGQPITLP
jgi:8-oxo-dGTP pyrophosphatase MutT (NUDIX family)